METFSALRALCAGNSTVTGEFPAQRAVTWSFDLHLNKWLLSKPSWGWWFETPSCSLWRHCNGGWVKVTVHLRPHPWRMDIFSCKLKILKMHFNILWKTVEKWVLHLCFVTNFSRITHKAVLFISFTYIIISPGTRKAYLHISAEVLFCRKNAFGANS